MFTPNVSRRQTLGLVVGGASVLLAPDRSAASARAAPIENNRDLGVLARAIRGSVVPKDSGAFEATRNAMVWNKRVAHARAPDAIVQVTSAQDVAAAIKYAKAEKLKIAVRGSGHNYHGAALRDGGLLLDLSRLKAMHIDAPNRRASVQAAVNGGELMAALEPQGLAFPVGHCSAVSLSGYILNGGDGWNMGEWGPACMNVTGMEMVTAGGDILFADERHNSELFWAARGAGPGFFAVVTRYDLALHPLPADIRLFGATFELEAAPVIANWLNEAIPRVHPTVQIVCSLGPIDATGKLGIVVIANCFSPSQAEAMTRLGPLRSMPAEGKRIGDIIDQPATYTDLFAGVDAAFPSGKRMAGDMHWVRSADVGDIIVTAQSLVVGAPPAPSSIEIVTLGGNKEPTRYDAALGALGRSMVGAYAFWDEPAADERSRAWVRSVMSNTERYKTGAYIGEADLSESADRVQECFSTEAWTRLLNLKKKFDPDELFFSYLKSA